MSWPFQVAIPLGFDAARSYGTVAEMLERERARPDGIDAVAIRAQ